MPTTETVPVERTASGGYRIPEADVEDWMLAGGAAPGHFDQITNESSVRGPTRHQAAHDDTDVAADTEVDHDAAASDAALDAAALENAADSAADETRARS